MTTFTIDTDNNITAHAEANSNQAAERFSTAKELAKLAEAWPGSRLVEIWNSLPGQKQIQKFTSRNTGVNRIWAAIQSLTGDSGAQVARVAPATAKSGKKGKKATSARKPPSRQKKPAPTVREGSKTAQVIALLEKAKGATLAELMKATGWQAHSVRGFLSGTIGKKMGLKLESTKREDGARVYSVAK
jgi:Protein of unknown function (DUF3489)